jgi:hypothetical protein
VRNMANSRVRGGGDGGEEDEEFEVEGELY